MSALRYVLGLDIGIQSVGWAVIRYEEPARIEDFGVRIFDTTENAREKNNANQERRAFRRARRVLRRRSQRKAMLKFHLQRMGLLKAGQVEAFFENGGIDLLSLRVKGLTERLSPVELAACLINMSNHRGYQEFYSLDEEDQKQLTAQEKKEYEEERSGIARVEAIMAQGNYRSVAEMLLKDETFAPRNNGTVRVYRSHPYSEERYPVSRDQMRREAQSILECQARFYPCLKQPYTARWKKNTVEVTNQEFLLWLMFEQRDFEDGPGDAQDPMRRYTGFLMSLGNCQFYKEEPRGARMTVLGDLFAVANALSQYRYISKETGELCLPRQMARELLETTLRDGEIPRKKIQEIAKKYQVAVDDKSVKTAEKAPNCVKFLKRVRPVLEQCGLDWEQALGRDPLSPDTLLNRIGRVLSMYQTPRRRKQELLKLQGVTPELAARLTSQKISGTAKVCDRYMRDAIEAFANGERYGEFQWRTQQEQEIPATKGGEGRHKKLPPFPANAEFAKNSVVMRSLNETRKVINAVVGRYGSPWAVNVEVASELGRSWAERAEIEKKNAQNQKKTLQDKQKICEIMGWKDPENVTGAMLERFRLAEQQGWQCLYTGRPIQDKRAALDPRGKSLEVDHIVPFSLILDNTLNNKALVLSDANQTKGQRTPLMYLNGQEQRQAFISRVNKMANDGLIGERKRRYLLLPDLRDSGLLDEWKTRNLNDTRYIAKYLRGYLERELAPAENHRNPFVYPVKGGLTSRFRRTWLSRDTWGTQEKDPLREQTTLHHAADAVVLANISPATAQIAEDNMRLNRILKANHGMESEEYRVMLERSLDTLEKFYHLPREKARKYLKRQNRIAALIDALNLEVDVRFGRPGEETDPETYRRAVRAYYRQDPAFAEKLTPPLTSRKQESKLQGTLTAGNPLGSKRIDGVLYERKRVDVLSLTRGDLNQLCTNDKDLLESLREWLGADEQEPQPDREEAEKKAKGPTLGQRLAEQGKTEFRTRKGRLIRKVTLQGNVLDTVKIKQISPANQSVLKTANYYCVEVYTNTEGQTKVWGIARTDLVKRDKKLWLACPLPADYAAHQMYLFKNDYITVETRNGLIFEGFYQSPSGLKQAKFNGIPGNSTKRVQFVVSGIAKVKKFDISILGKKGGEIRCGEPLSLLPEKK